MRLSELKSGEKATVVKVLGYGALRKRIMEMGFVRGKEVTPVLNAPLKDPIIYKVMDYEVSLRRSEAQHIVVVAENQQDSDSVTSGVKCETIAANSRLKSIDSSAKHINIALVGNPNSGKTSLFNMASGAHEHVGNYSGVTVDAKRGGFKYRDYTFSIVDLPGTYSLSGYSPEELYVRRHLIDSTPDVVVNVVAASNIERNLYLTTELIDMDSRMVVAMNMYDELHAKGAELDYDALAQLLGTPIVPTNSRNREGFAELFETVIEVYEGRSAVARHIHINHGAEVESAVKELREIINEDNNLTATFSSRYLAIKSLEKDEQIEKVIAQSVVAEPLTSKRDLLVKHIEQSVNEDIESYITAQKYGFISGALGEVYTPGVREQAQTTKVIDSIITHKFWGFPIFLTIMWLMFTVTFNLGAYPMEWIEGGVEFLSSFVDSVMGEGMLKDLIIDGVIGGVGGVVVFLPNIVILYLFISFMEDSGYMARAAFIMDKLMHLIGLHGKSFIPFVMGFGCNVPAMKAARIIESRSSRLITILVNPFFSCSARLPVYLLFVGAFFPVQSGTILFLIYVIGVVTAIVTAKMLRKFTFKEDETPFVMELPPYRVPTLRATWVHMWEKSCEYLKKMGGLVLVASIIIWFMSYFPRSEEQTFAQQQESSYLGQLGSACAPIMEPLGFDWRANVALISGMAAKEIVVSTLSVLYVIECDKGEDEQNEQLLAQRLQSINPQTGKPFFTPITALSFMIFVLLCFPCIASLAAIKAETGSWKWVLFSVLYNTSLAWMLAWIVKVVGDFLVGL